MAAPTRAQIEAWVAKPKYKVEIWLPADYIGAAGWNLVDEDDVKDVSGSIQSTGDTLNGYSFGTQVDAKATITLATDAALTAYGDIREIPLRETKARISFGFDTSDYVVAFVGPILQVGYDETVLTIECGSFFDIIQDSKMYTEVWYNRPIATTTTVASQEDPDEPAYEAGVLNEILFRSGGRPIEQLGLNGYEEHNTLFWYSSTHGLWNPPWIWINGENLLDEALTLVRAIGGQLYQDTDGVIKYVQPLELAAGTGTYEYNSSRFGKASVQRSKQDFMKTLRVTATPRNLQGIQTVYEDNTPRLVIPGVQVTIEVETTLPVYRFTNTDTSEIFKSRLFTGQVAYPNIASISTKGQKVTIVIENGYGANMIIDAMVLKGQPIVASDEVSITYSYYDNEPPERLLEKNPYVQDEGNALRLAKMVVDFYGDERPVVTLTDCPFDPDRFIGETVLFDYPHLSFYDQTCRIIEISHNIGTKMDVKLVPLNVSFPIRSDMFIIGESYSSGTVKLLSY